MGVLGTVQTVVVCIDGSSGIQGACPAGQVETVTKAYLVTPSEGMRLDAMAVPFDPVQAGAFFGFAFASTIFVWLFSLGVGHVVKLVRTA
ncbi:hypothetical protein [Massilia sp. NR 4-1]|uniref:hypothetical protein n=1 Tax=Massilia sp. NR 4-1 TaxID=1678028 RepID=UPI00067B380F|nr:hypothetical protein [Massilia sp. NR 4-1]AKU20996.1 hypothetical protein ACZ75_05285 [Massilia sp. NR 4-1]